MSNWTLIRDELFYARDTCEVIHDGRVCGRTAEELHHGVVPRDKRFRKYIDREWNAQPSCHICNFTRLADADENRLHFIREQLERGYNIRAELDAFPEAKKRGSHWKRAKRMVEDEIINDDK